MPAPADAPGLWLLLHLADRLGGRTPDLRHGRGADGQPIQSRTCFGQGGEARQLAQRQSRLGRPLQRACGQLRLNPRLGPIVQLLGLVQQQQAGTAQGGLLTGGQACAGGQGRGIQHQHRRLHGQHPGPGRLAQLRQQLQGVAQAGRLDQQTVRPGLAQQPAQADLEGYAVDAAQAATGHLAHGHAVGVAVEQGGVQADQAELVDQHRPAFAGRALGQQVADQAGLAGAQGAGDQMGGDILEHGPMVRVCLPGENPEQGAD
ncbi:hypothetical protein D3C84_430610 [compost metagenome]